MAFSPFKVLCPWTSSGPAGHLPRGCHRHPALRARARSYHARKSPASCCFSCTHPHGPLPALRATFSGDATGIPRFAPVRGVTMQENPLRLVASAAHVSMDLFRPCGPPSPCAEKAFLSKRCLPDLIRPSGTFPQPHPSAYRLPPSPEGKALDAKILLPACGRRIFRFL